MRPISQDFNGEKHHRQEGANWRRTPHCLVMLSREYSDPSSESLSNQHLAAFRYWLLGSKIVNLVPLPSSLSTVIEP